MDITEWIEIRYGLQPTDEELRVRAEYPISPSEWPLDADLEDYSKLTDLYFREATARLALVAFAAYVRHEVQQAGAALGHVFTEDELIERLDREMEKRLKVRPVGMPDVPLLTVLEPEI